jgi:acetyl-CoA carboxylase carboxyltransferase component
VPPLREEAGGSTIEFEELREEVSSEPAALPPRERLEALCDPDSVHVIRSVVRGPASLGSKAKEGDGVVGASATVGGRPVFCFAEDGNCAGGSLGEAHAETIVRVMDLAGQARVPIIGFIESAGARMQEGTRALGAYARVFRANVRLSGCVPQISIVTGSSAGGGCYSPALTDFVIMTGHASMFLTGPEVVRQVTGEEISSEELGGTRVHERNGVCQLVAPTEMEAAARARELLSYLPQSAFDDVPMVSPEPAGSANPGASVPRKTSRVYDVREVVRGIVDGGRILELAPRWARNIVTCFARLEGRSIGVIANNPHYLGGVLDASAAQKGAKFVRTCNSFGIPLVVLVDTPGFMPGKKQESVGVIRHGAKLLHAFAEASVPKVTVVLRQAYGGGYITMNSRELGADFVYAWPRAALGIMGARPAVTIIHRAEIREADDPAAEIDRLAAEYAAHHQGAMAAAREGAIDEVILPAETRSRLTAALDALAAKPGARGTVKNIPL